jgi:hypothetical protein
LVLRQTAARVEPLLTWTVRQESGVILRMMRVMARPMRGSAIARLRAAAAGDDTEADDGIDAGVAPVGDEGNAVWPPAGAEAYASGDRCRDSRALRRQRAPIDGRAVAG